MTTYGIMTEISRDMLPDCDISNNHKTLEYLLSKFSNQVKFADGRLTLIENSNDIVLANR